VKATSSIMTGDIPPRAVDPAASMGAHEAALEAAPVSISGPSGLGTRSAARGEQRYDEAVPCTRCLHRTPVDGGKTCEVCREVSRRYSRKYWDNLPPEKRAERSGAARKRQQDDPAKAREYQRRSRDKKRRAAFRRYGDACACCGERTSEFLQLHHLDGGGNEHRRAIGNGSAYWNAFSGDQAIEDVEILCGNCHVAVTRTGSCPHKKPSAIRPAGPVPDAGLVEELPFLSMPACPGSRQSEGGPTHAC
jgi:hypothetical protein